MTPRSWVAVLAVLLLSVVLVARLRAARRGEEHDVRRRFFRAPGAFVGLVVVCFIVLAAAAAPLIAPYPPSRQLDIVALQNRPPSWLHPLGTDVYSRDLLSRLLFGARVTLGVAALAVLVAVGIGTLVGLVAGYGRRWTDGVLMRIVDIGLAVPRLFVFLMVVALWDRLPLGALILLLGATGWFVTSRLVRAEVLSLRERLFVDATRASGARPSRVVFRHILPNAMAPIVVSAVLGLGNVMLLEAALSFLGIGVAPPTPSWGNMLAEGRDQLLTAPWTTLFPGLAIAAVVMACNAVGDALRRALNPLEPGG